MVATAKEIVKYLVGVVQESYSEKCFWGGGSVSEWSEDGMKGVGLVTL